MAFNESILHFGNQFCRPESKDDRKPLRTLLENNYRNAFELADKLSTVLDHYFATGEGMTESEAVTTANTVAHLLHAGNDSVAAWMKMKEDKYPVEGKRTHTLRQCISVVCEFYPTGKKIQTIKEIRNITGCSLKEAKDFVELVCADIACGALTEKDI